MKKILWMFIPLLLLTSCDKKVVITKDVVANRIAATEGLIAIEEIFLKTIFDSNILSKDQMKVFVDKNNMAREHLNKSKELLGIDVNKANDEVLKSSKEVLETTNDAKKVVAESK